MANLYGRRCESLKAKDYLMQYRESIDRTKELAAHLDELKAEAVRLRDHEGQKVELDEAVGKYVDACTDAAAYLEMLADKRNEIESTINKIKSEKLRTLLRYRYIHGKTWEQIAVDMNYTYRRITQLHGKAISVIDALINP